MSSSEHSAAVAVAVPYPAPSNSGSTDVLERDPYEAPSAIVPPPPNGYPLGDTSTDIPEGPAGRTVFRGDEKEVKEHGCCCRTFCCLCRCCLAILSGCGDQ